VVLLDDQASPEGHEKEDAEQPPPRPRLRQRPSGSESEDICDDSGDIFANISAVSQPEGTLPFSAMYVL
jgi:hypothetical protein